MNKIMDLICRLPKLETALEQNTQPPLLISTYVTRLVNVKIEQCNQTVCKGTVKDVVAFWQVFVSDIGYY
ncbi:hypothetical protein NIES2100_55640 [Calothrix sp. NIES-2100]|uniref:hypothetical protein n=1 Tax=Calothrix sp. NIES-2100 TaxID=1954172 RepID=UPI000B614D5C|nr:hypothetical protein NIES2100_55640 [Calothrix sp. NIES-2100]